MPLSLQAVAARVDAGGCTLVRAVLAVHDQPLLDGCAQQWHAPQPALPLWVQVDAQL